MALPPPGYVPIPQDEITISRPLQPQENVARGLAARRAVLRPPLLAAIGLGPGVLLALVVGALTSWSVAWMLIVFVLGAGTFGLGALLGAVLGNKLAKTRSEREIGLSRVLTVVWSTPGCQITGENFRRSFPYTDIRWVRMIDETAVLRLPLRLTTETYVIGLPTDFVPEQALAQIRAAGGRIH